MIRLILILLSLSLAFISCSQQSGKTSAEFRLSMGALGTPAKFAGGLVVYGRNLDNSRSFVQVLDQQNNAREVENGKWTFYAIGWDAPDTDGGTGKMSGKVYCGIVGDINLDGNPVEVNLNVSNSKCSEKVFTTNHISETSATGEKNIHFPKLQVETCNALDPGMLNDSSINCNYDSNPSSYTALKGYAASYRLEVRSFIREKESVNLEGPTLISSCQNVSTAVSGSLAETDFGGLNIPTGNRALNTPFQFYIRAFYDQNCQDSRGYKDIVLRHGTLEDHDDVKAINYDSGTKKIKLFVKTSLSDVCSGDRLDFSEFAAGLGETGHPYVICNLSQFNKINSHLASSFVLGRDLNFLPQTAAYMTSPLTCTNFLENFVPIGGYSDCSDFTEDNPSTFSGNFDGLGKTLENIRLEKEDAEQIGLIRHLTGKLMNLTIENAYVVGGNEVGAAVGRCNKVDTNSCEIYNVTVKDSKVESSGVGASSVVGGVVGYAEYATIKKVLVYDSRIVGQQESVGGVAGKVVSSTFSKALAENIQVKGNSNGANDVGGVVGYADQTNLSEVAAKGYVKSEGQYVGGVVGYFFGSEKSISDAYSHVYLDSRKNSMAFAGGLVGKTQGAITNSYVAGKVSHKCSANDSTCFVGCVAGNNASSTDVFCEEKSNIMILGGYDGNPDGAYDIASMRNSTATGYYGTKLNSNPNWTKTDKMLPRLSFEPEKPCHLAANIALVSDQLNNGRGTSDNPVIICHPAQPASIEDNSSAYYQLEESFRVGEVTTNNMLLGFNGVFNGKNKYLFDLQLNENEGGNYAGLFKTIETQGVVKNFAIQVQDITSGGSFANGAIAGKNEGTIENVSVLLSSDIVLDKLGGVVGENHGTMTQVYSYGEASGDNLGGIAFRNSGTISECFSEMDLEEQSFIGGIAAINTGAISECESSVNIHGGNNSKNIGGIAGVNSGTITNSFFSDSGEIFLESGVTPLKNGAIVGENSGTVSKTYSAGMVYTGDPFNGPGGPVGNPGASITASLTDSYYLENSIGKNYGSISGDTLFFEDTFCDPTVPSYTVKPTTYTDGTASDLDGKSYSNGDIIKVTATNGTIQFLTITDDPAPGAFSDGNPLTFDVGSCDVSDEEEVAMFTPISTGDDRDQTELSDEDTYQNWDILSESNPADEDRYKNFHLNRLGLKESNALAPVWLFGGEYPFLFKIDNE